MKGHFSIVYVAVMGIAFAVAHSSQAGIIVTGPRVIVSPPVAIAPVPDYYVWDGSEFVGVVGNQYYYLGPGNVWMVMDPVRLNRFNVWARRNPGWRGHATRNTRYRRGGPVRPPAQTRSGGPPPRHPAGNGPSSNQNQGRGNRGQGRGQNNPP